MKIELVRLIAVVSLFVFGTAVNATSNTLGEYNLILIEDYNLQGGDVQGRAFIGGDLNGGVAEFGSRLANTDQAIDAVSIVGSVNAQRVRVLNDNNVVYAQTLSQGRTPESVFELNDGDDGRAIFDPSLSISDIAAELYADSAYFESLNTSNQFDFGSFNSNTGALSYSGNDSSVVFDLEASDIFSNNTNINANINFGALDAVIINVGGTDINVGGGVNVNGFGNSLNQNLGTTNVIWNFYEATSINFNNIAVAGAVLAPYADVTGGAVFDGAFAALSYTGAREFHNFVFNFDTPVTDVSAPGATLIFMSALFYLVRVRKPYRQS